LYEGGPEAALATVTQPVLVMGISSDMLYPLFEQQQLASYLPSSEFQIINSMEGHDGFLLEQNQVSFHIENFLKRLGL
jgi:homoserine O-acetyltransferase